MCISKKLLAYFLLASLTACGGGGGGGSNTGTAHILSFSPDGLTYECSSYCIFTVGVDINPLQPNSTGGQVTQYSVSPALPAGVHLDSSTGILSGTPTVVTAPNPYIITASNSLGSTDVEIIISTPATVPDLLEIEYPNEVLSLVANESITLIPFFVGQITNCSIAAGTTLPAGLILDSKSCVISGTPTTEAVTTTTIIASNGVNQATETISITVSSQPTAPSGLDYGAQDFTYSPGEHYAPEPPPSYKGGQICDFSVSPALPAGMDLNAETGAWSGTPTMPSPKKTYTITGTSCADNTLTTQATFTITVVDPPQGFFKTVHFKNPDVNNVEYDVNVYFAQPFYWAEIKPVQEILPFHPPLPTLYQGARAYCNYAVQIAVGGVWELPGLARQLSPSLLPALQQSYNEKSPDFGSFKDWNLGTLWTEDKDFFVPDGRVLRSTYLADIANKQDPQSIVVGTSKIVKTQNGFEFTVVPNGEPLPENVTCYATTKPPGYP